jgi:hypothetical protein
MITPEPAEGKTYCRMGVFYTYDQGTNGKGHRTYMDEASGNTIWTYDARGRV